MQKSVPIKLILSVSHKIVVLLWRDEMCISSLQSPFFSLLEIFPIYLDIVKSLQSSFKRNI